MPRAPIALLTLLVSVPAAAQVPEPPAGAAVTVDMGPVKGSGTLTDREGKPIGRWQVEAVLRAGRFAGTFGVEIQGQKLVAPLIPARSYLENGRCHFAAEDGRARAELAGRCTAAGFGGTLSAFIPTGEVYSVNGYATGELAFAAPGKPPASGVVPTARLTCAYQERIGGVVAGDLARYELRYSNMGFLELSAAGTYRTANTAGRWVRGPGNSIRLTSGQFAGAVGRLEPDRSGAPAVYFERDENRDAKGVPIVDVARTSCTVARGR